MQAADRLHMAVTDLMAHDESLYWLHHAEAAIYAENHAAEQRNKGRG